MFADADRPVHPGRPSAGEDHRSQGDEHPSAVEPAFAALAAATAIRENVTLCLASSLVHPELSEAIPFASDIVLPRGTRHPAGLANVS